VKALNQACGAVALIALGANPLFAAPPYSLSVTLAPPVVERLDQSLGTAEGPVLQRIVSEAVARAVIPGQCSTTAHIDVSIDEAAPTHPTRQQLFDQPGLDFLRSKSIGGAALSARLLDANGTVIDSFNYRHFAIDIWQGSAAAETWSDARIAVDYFAHKLARECSKIADSPRAAH
jgi:hypothetical protein